MEVGACVMSTGASLKPAGVLARLVTTGHVYYAW